MNRDNSKSPLQRTLIALAIVAMVLIFAAAVANGRRRATMQIPTPPANGSGLADVPAGQASDEIVVDASDPLAVADDGAVDASGSPAGEATSTAGAPAQPAAVSSGEARVRPLTEAINVRRGPGTSFAIDGALKQTETAAVVARTPASDWYLIRRDNGMMGWVAANVVEFVLGERGAIGVAVTVPSPPRVATAAPPPPVEDKPPADEPEPPVTHPPVTQAPPPPTTESPVMKTPTPNPYP